MAPSLGHTCQDLNIAFSLLPYHLYKPNVSL